MKFSLWLGIVATWGLSPITASAWDGATQTDAQLVRPGGFPSIDVQPSSESFDSETLSTLETTSPRDAASSADKRGWPSMPAGGLANAGGAAGGNSDARDNATAVPSPFALSGASLTTTCSALAIVLGLFAVMVWAGRRFGKPSATLPSADLVKSLGSVTLDARTTVVMLRVGRRIVVATRGGGSLVPLCEITDPDEVAEILGRCDNKSAREFEQTLNEIARTPASGFTAPPPQNLFASA